MMRLKVQQVFDATQVLATIINENRPLPTKGKYRIARMHAKLFQEFTTANEQRTAKIISYDHKNEEGNAAVPDDKMPEFVAWWKEMAGVEIDVNVDPIPLDQLSLGDDAESAIKYDEFAALGELVSD